MVVFTHKLCCQRVVQMPCIAAYPRLEELGIAACVEHGAVVVRLDHEEVGLCHVVFGAWGDDTHVGGNDKLPVVPCDGEAHVVGAVV